MKKDTIKQIIQQLQKHIDAMLHVPSYDAYIQFHQQKHPHCKPLAKKLWYAQRLHARFEKKDSGRCPC
jgi:uncharacterized short protein YbdD (DUF466 family)